MKKIYLLAIFQFTFFLSYSQTLTYNQVLNLYDTWVKAKGLDYKTVNTHIKAVSPKWILESVKPTIEEDTKYFKWSSPILNNDTLLVATYIEEDDETVKFDIRYVFFSKLQFQTFENSMRATETTVTSFKNNKKQETEYFSQGPTRSILLREFPVEDANPEKFAYTLDIFSRYIPKSPK